MPDATCLRLHAGSIGNRLLRMPLGEADQQVDQAPEQVAQHPRKQPRARRRTQFGPQDGKTLGEGGGGCFHVSWE
jgi:hypothetical protein